MARRTSKPPPSDRRRFLRRRLFGHTLAWWKAWTLRCAFAIPLVFGVAWIVLTHSPLTKRIVVPQVARALGVDLHARRVVITVDGRVILDGVEARVPDIDNAAGTFCKVERLTASIDWPTTILAGHPRVTRIELANPLVRISQSIEDKSLNVASLHIISSAAGTLDLPTVSAQNAVVELGEHTRTTYTTLRRLFLAGELTPARYPAIQAYDVNLWEAGPQFATLGSAGGMRLSGRIDDHGAEINLTGIHLDAIDPKTVPTPVRDLFTQLDLEGAVTEARVNYSSRSNTIVGTLILNGVDITPPIPAEQLESGVTRPMRMRDTSGSVSLSPTGLRAKLTGYIEDLPYEIELDFQGTSLDSPFVATIDTNRFSVSENPDLLPYAPEMVRRRFANFSNPTALVDASVTISRGEPTAEGAAPIQVDGRLEFINGRASFEKFPYPFHDMTARVHFTDHSIEIEKVTGVADSGAKVSASGTIEPLTDYAYASIDVHVTDAPVDDMLLDGLGAGRRKLVEAIISRAEYQRLVNDGLVSPDPDSDLPHFELGGIGTIDVNVQREAGPAGIWHTHVDVHFDHVGFLVEKFPYPIVGTDVTIQIRDDDVRVAGGTFTGLQGGTADIDANITLVGSGQDQTFIPHMTVQAHDIPLGDLLAAALPDRPPGEDAGVSPRRILGALGMSGTGSASVTIGPKGTDQLTYKAVAHVTGAECLPDGADADAAIHRISATVTTTDTDMHLVADGYAGPSGATAPVHVEVDSEYGKATNSRVQISGIDTTLPMEAYVAIFSEKAARELRDVQAKMHPEGTVDLGITAEHQEGKETVTLVDVTNPNGLAFDLFDGRIGVGKAAGIAVIEAKADPRIEFRSLAAAVTYDAQPAGHVVIDGRVPLAALAKREAPTPLPDDVGSLRLRATDAIYQSPFARWIVDRFLPPKALDFYDHHNPRGLFDADVTMTPIVGDDANYTFDPEGTLIPRTVTITRAALDIPLATNGQLRFGRRWGTFENLGVTTPDWHAAATGSWNAGAQAIDYEIALDLQADSLTDDLRAMLPTVLTDKFDVVNLRVGGPISMSHGRLEGTRAPTDQLSTMTFNGNINFEDAALEPGVEIAEAAGVVDVGFENIPAHGPPAYELAIAADSMRAARIRLTDVSALMLSGERPREVLVPHFSAQAHSGRVSASVQIWPTSGAPDAPLEYRTDLRLSGVRFGPLLRDVMPDQEPDATEDDRSRGAADGAISLTGIVGRHDTRRGSGILEILGGSVLRLPSIIISLIEISNLQPPASEDLDYARAKFFIDGDFIGFEELSIFSRSVAILGSGSMLWDTKYVDLSFHTRAARRIPMLSQIIEGIRDELATATVKGPMNDYAIRVEQFSGDSELFDSLFNARRRRIASQVREADPISIEPITRNDSDDE